MARNMQNVIGIVSAELAQTEQQQAVVDKILKGPRGSVPTPFLSMLDAPMLTDAIQRVGEVIRFHSSLSDAYRETAILAVAGAVKCGYEWTYHAPIALASGVPQDVVNATLNDQPIISDERLSLIIDFCRQIAIQRQALPDIMLRAVTELGREATTELIAIAGYYSLLASFIKSTGRDTEIPSKVSL